jgi:hypothetical protein
MSRYRWIGALIVVVFLLGAALLIVMKAPVNRVRFIVPDGFHGIFVIVEDAVHGDVPKRNANTVTYRIPKSGVLYSRDVQPLKSWHASSASFYSGDNITDDRLADENRYYYFPLDADSDGKIKSLIGTRRDAEEYWRTRRIWFEFLE